MPRVPSFPKTKQETEVFYFLVVTCGIAPSEVSQMTPLQIDTLVYLWNKKQEEEARKAKRRK